MGRKRAILSSPSTLVSAYDETGKPIVLAVLKGREKEPLVDFLKTIPTRLRRSKEVCTDLYDGFIHAVEEVLPQAKIVADRFRTPNSIARPLTHCARSR